MGKKIQSNQPKKIILWMPVFLFSNVVTKANKYSLDLGTIKQGGYFLFKQSL